MECPPQCAYSTHKQHTNNAEQHNSTTAQQHSSTAAQQHSSTAYKAATQSYNSKSTAQSATPQTRNAGTPRHIKTITTIKAKHGDNTQKTDPAQNTRSYRNPTQLLKLIFLNFLLAE